MDIANLVVTLISIVVTIVGIIFSYKAMTSAKDASMNSKKALELADNFDVFAFVRQFDNAVKDILLKTQSPSWTKGKSEDEIANISAPLLSITLDFNQIYSKLNLSDFEKDTLTRDVEGVRSALKKLSNVHDNRIYISTIENNCSSISKVMNSYLQKIKVKSLNDE